MSKRRISMAVAVLFLGVWGAGCVTPGQKQTPPRPAEPSPVSPDRIATGFVASGRELESRGSPEEALRRYRMALAVDVGNQEALEAAARLEKDLKEHAEKRYQAGLAFHKQGKYGKARHEFLVALRLRPDHPEAAEMLVDRKRVRSTRYVVHEVAPGESLSHLAKRYYGDHRKFPEIARYNSITDATRVDVGQKIKVPEIEGVPFQTGAVQVRTEEKRAPEAGLWEWGTLEAARSGTTEAVIDVDSEARIAACRADGMALFEQKKYRQSIEAFERVLEVAPDDATALDYAFQAHYRLAESLLEKKEYLAAREGFMASLRIRSDCSKCHQYIQRSEDLYKEAHYRKGMQYYNQEKLKEAIREWERVQRLDPNYKRVDYLIEKARKILSKLRDLKQEQGKP